MTNAAYPHLYDETPEEIAKWIREVTRLRDEDVIQYDTLFGQVNGGREIFDLTPSTSQNNYSTGITAPANVISTLRINPSNTIKITGILSTDMENGKTVRIFNSGSVTAAASRLLIIERESSSSTAANRFNWQQGIPPILLMPGDWCQFEYDSTLARWRYSSGSRHYGSIRGNFDEFDDGLGSTTPFTTSVSGVSATVAVGTYLGGDTTERSFGAVSCQTGTDTTGKAYWETSAFVTMFTGGCLLFAARCCPSSALSDGTDTYQALIGMHDASTSTDVVDGAYWRYDSTVSTDWRTGTASNSTRTLNTVTGFTVSISAYHTLGVFMNYDGTQADYFYMTGADAVTISGTSHTTNIPPNTRFFGFSAGINKTAGTTNRNLAVDWMGWRSQVKRGA